MSANVRLSGTKNHRRGANFNNTGRVSNPEGGLRVLSVRECPSASCARMPSPYITRRRRASLKWLGHLSATTCGSRRSLIRMGTDLRLKVRRMFPRTPSTQTRRHAEELRPTRGSVRCGHPKRSLTWRWSRRTYRPWSRVAAVRGSAPVVGLLDTANEER